MADGTYTEHISRFERTLDKWEMVLEEQGSNIREIKQALLGSEFGEQGIVRRLEITERDVEDLKNFKTKITAYVIGVSTASGATVAGVIKLIFGV